MRLRRAGAEAVHSHQGAAPVHYGREMGAHGQERHLVQGAMASVDANRSGQALSAVKSESVCAAGHQVANLVSRRACDRPGPDSVRPNANTPAGDQSRNNP